MNNTSTKDKIFSETNSELTNHMPRSFQTMLRIEGLAQERLEQIKKSIERGETTLESVKKDRGLL